MDDNNSQKIGVVSAFTLIELLVVIAIIGLIATISVIALSNARAKSRDAKRVADMKQIQTALEMYFNDNNHYPSADEFNDGAIFSATTDGTATYMAVIPTAPSVADGNCNSDNNSYFYQATESGASYNLSFCLGGRVSQLVSGLKCLTPGGIMEADCSSGCAINSVGCTWKMVGEANFGIDQADDLLSFYIDGDIPYVAYKHFGQSCNGKIMVESFIDGSWSKISHNPDCDFVDDGTSMSNVALTVSEGVPYIFYRNGNDLLNVQKYQGGWQSVGDPDFIAAGTPISGLRTTKIFVDNNIIYIAFWDSNQNIIKVMSYNGNEQNPGWQEIGASESASIYFDFVVNNHIPYLAYADNSARLVVKYYNYDERFAL